MGVARRTADFGYLVCTGAWGNMFSSIVHSSGASRLNLNPSAPVRPRASSGLSVAAPGDGRSRACSSVTRYSDDWVAFVVNEDDVRHEVPRVSFRPCLPSRDVTPTKEDEFGHQIPRVTFRPCFPSQHMPSSMKDPTRRSRTGSTVTFDLWPEHVHCRWLPTPRPHVMDDFAAKEARSRTVSCSSIVKERTGYLPIRSRSSTAF